MASLSTILQPSQTAITCTWMSRTLTTRAQLGGAIHCAWNICVEGLPGESFWYRGKSSLSGSLGWTGK